MNKSKAEKKNELEEKCEYLILKERRERLINYCLIIFILFLLISSIIYINNVRYKKKEEIAFTNTTNNEKNDNNGFIRFIYDGFNHNYPPNKKEYVINSVSCNNANGEWDNKKWQLNISGIVDKVSCSLTFKKKNDIIAITNTKVNKQKQISIKKNVKQESSIIKQPITIKKDTSIISNNTNNEELDKDNNIIDNDNNKELEIKDEILLDLDKCDNIDECNYKVIMDSNKEIRLNPIIKSNDEISNEIDYELLSGNNAIELYNGGLICSKNVVDEVAYVKATVKDKPELNSIIKVIVEAKLINTRVYNINRHNDTINKIELKTNINSFINNIMNKSEFIHVFNNNNEIINHNEYIKTGMIVKLIINNKIYDELEIIVLGDVNKDGVCNNLDYDLVYQYISGQIELNGSSFLAADINKDNKVDSLDYELIYRYISNYINSFNNL